MTRFQTQPTQIDSGFARSPYVPWRGAHISVDRGTYTHHGIDRGDGTAVDFGGLGGRRGKASGVIQVVTLAEFAAGGTIRVRRYGRCDEPELVIRRAESKIGESGYHLFNSNCEHFATWCMTGSHESAQVQAAGSVAVGLATHQLAPRVAKDIVAGLGKATPSSAGNTTSGLKALGGSAAGGVGVVAAGGAVAGSIVVSLALKDRPYLTPEERDVRKVGRAVGVGGAALTPAGVFCTVGVLGVPGYSAAGISSGLAAVGRATGGGMIAGLGVAVSAPVIIAWMLGLLGAVLADWWSDKQGAPKLCFQQR